jgi:H+-translocating NAD(P) transhydrogenase subunit beta
MNRPIGDALASVALALRRIGRKEGGTPTPAARTLRTLTVAGAAAAMGTASRVVVVPGYGLAVARAHHALAALCRRLGARGADVAWAIHPAAGRIPGHMNVLLDEADVPHAALLDVPAANARLAGADLALIVGADDIVNPGALLDESGPLHGLEIIEAHRARTVLVVKPTLSPSASGVHNLLFDEPHVAVLLDDAHHALTALSDELDHAPPR